MTLQNKKDALSVMKDNIEWLKSMEEGAASLYCEAALTLTDDKELRDLLVCLKQDEDEHARLMALALSLCEGIPTLSVPFEIDESIKIKHKAVNKRIMDMIEDGSLTGYAMLDATIELEHAELNPLFTFVTDSLKESSQEFVDFHVEIEKHKKSIERFIRSRPEYELLAKKIPTIPKVWNEKILIVDKSEPFIKLMEVVLTKEGMVDGTGDGKEALRRIREDYFDLIIADINIMGIDGMDLYREALKTDSAIKDRMLFLSSNNSDKCIDFFKDEEIRYLIKPASIKEIIGQSIDILQQRRYLEE